MLPDGVVRMVCDIERPPETVGQVVHASPRATDHPPAGTADMTAGHTGRTADRAARWRHVDARP